MVNKEEFTFYLRAGSKTSKKQVGLVLSCFFLLSLLQSQRRSYNHFTPKMMQSGYIFIR